MNESETKEFEEWYNLMKERADRILKDPGLKDEQRTVFIERGTEPFGTWKLGKQRVLTQNGTSTRKSQNLIEPGRPENGHLKEIIEKYKLIRDGQGIKIGPFINDWTECTQEMEREGYFWSKETRRFVSKEV